MDLSCCSQETPPTLPVCFLWAARFRVSLRLLFLLHTPLCRGGDTAAPERPLLSSELLEEDEDEEEVDEETPEPSISLSVKKKKSSNW